MLKALKEIHIDSFKYEKELRLIYLFFMKNYHATKKFHERVSFKLSLIEAAEPCEVTYVYFLATPNNNKCMLAASSIKKYYFNLYAYEGNSLSTGNNC